MGDQRELTSPHSHIEILHNHAPYYMSIGMSYDQYWHGNPSMVRDYREADRLRRKRDNFNAWLQGVYVYEAIADISPILQMGAKKGTKPKPYPKEPYPGIVPPSAEEKRREEQKKAEEAEKAQKKAFEYFSALERVFNGRKDNRRT